MKKITYTLAAIFASAFALTSCTKEMTDSSKDIESQGIPFEICASVSQTRTTTDNSWNTTWVAKDAINLFHAKAGTTTYVSDDKFTVENIESGKFKGKLTGILTADSYDWYAFYPYSSYNKTPAGDAQSNFGYTTIGGTSQTQTGNNSQAHLCGKPCPLYGVVKSVSKSSSPTISMQQLVSVIEVNVTNNSGEDLTVSSVSFTGTEDIVGTFYINFTGTPVYTIQDASSVSETVSLTVSEGAAIANGASAKFYLAIKPFTAASRSNLKLSVNGYEKTKELTSDVTFAAGKIKTLNFKYDNIPSDDVYTLVETDGAFENDGKYVLAIKDGKTGDYYFISNAGTSNTLVKSALTVMDSKITNPDAKYVFTAETANSGYKLKNSQNNYICNTKSTTLHTNYTSSSTWVSSFISDSKTYKLQVSSTDGRYMGAKSVSEVGAYANTNYVNQIADKKNVAQFAGAISVFKLGYDFTTEPVILADNISNVSARGESAGVLNYTIQNPVEETSIFATCDGVVVTQVVEQEGSFLYKVAPNQTTSARKGSITLTYGAVTKIVTVSQLAPVFTVSRTEVELEAKAESSTTITITSDFDWYSEASSAAGFISTPTTCEWTTEPPYTDGKTTVTIKANAANDSKEGTKELGTLTFTNLITKEILIVTVKQKSSYVTGKPVTFTFDGGKGSAESLTWTDGTVTLVAAKGDGSTNPNEHAKDKQLRFYAKNTITVSGATLKKITFNVGTWKTLSVTSGSITDKVWTPNDSSTNIVTFTNTEDAQARYNSITIEYE